MWQTGKLDPPQAYQNKTSAAKRVHLLQQAEPPVEASGEVKYKTGLEGKAALNAEKLFAKYKDAAKEYGIWAIQAVWITDACAITMSSGNNRDVDVALDVGATGFGKVGGGRALVEKLDSEGWTAYKSESDRKGRVVSFSGFKFKPHKFTKFFRNSVTFQGSGRSVDGPTAHQAIHNEEGRLRGVEKVKRVMADDGFYDI
ncbi:hypothetical protein PENANT_c053G08892, partial [Penicillium antarcticum]